jgi:K+-sensing histidine kinase KdpD
MTVGTERRFIAITRDISARKRTERLKSDLIATLSHELRTPLSAALGSLGLLAEVVGSKLGGEDERLLSIARSNLDRLVRSVNEVLDVDHRQLIDVKFAPRRISLTELLREAIAADADYAHGRHVRLAFDPCSHRVFVNGDKSLLLRALSHVITNAIHLSPPHSTVELSVVNEGGQGVLSIRDCGTAVPIEARPCLFDASANLSSFGIVAPRGLCTARIIIEKHGGSVGYEPREAGGSHFFFRLPLFAKAAGSA